MVEGINDIHMHIVPNVDDGSASMEMSIAMLRMAYEQGARKVICTSHNWLDAEDRDNYLRNLKALQKRVAAEGIDVKLCPGNEVRFDIELLEEKLELLKSGILLPLNGTDFVLTEFTTDVSFEAAATILQKLIEAGYKPVIAHAERYDNLTVAEIGSLIGLGCRAHINAYSLVKEKKEHIRAKAQQLLKEQLVSFLGSDAHKTYHRPPDYETGVGYILEHCLQTEAEGILWRNADTLLFAENGTPEGR